MHVFSKKLRLTLMSLVLIPSMPFAKEIILDQGYGEEQAIVIGEDQSFSEVMDYLVMNLADDKSASQKIEMDVYVANDRIHMKAAAKPGTGRDYSAPTRQSDIDDISFILGTMAKSSLISIATQRSALKRAGERIDHLHPLRFLEVIFSSEELKAYVGAVRNKSFVWKEFLSGIVGSLEDEAKNKNLTNEQLKEFAAKFNVDLNPLMPLVKEKKWKEFVNKLIDTIPRDGDTKRYDM
jgi:hypothetical protein